MSAALRIILCGQSPLIANPVKAGLLPEYESEILPVSSQHMTYVLILVAIHVILGSPAGVKDLPLLLSGQTPPATDEPNLGTRDYSKKADAIITGGGYDDENFSVMKNACAGLPGKGGIPWLRPDMSVPVPPLGSVNLSHHNHSFMDYSYFEICYSYRTHAKILNANESPKASVWEGNGG